MLDTFCRLTLRPWPFHIVFSTMLSAAEFRLFLADHDCTIIPSLMEAKMYASFLVRLFVASDIQRYDSPCGTV